jgi:hypothetical protein
VPVHKEGREAPTWPELVARLAERPPDRAARILARVQPAPRQPEPETGAPPPVPKFVSWDDFLARTTATEQHRWSGEPMATGEAARCVRRGA